MNQLYQPLNVKNYDLIRKELFDLVPEDYLKTLEVKSWFVHPLTLLTKCPELKKFLLSRLKKLVVVAKFYVSPPYKGTWHHIDGTDWRNPFGLCFPILNTENTYFCWYKEDLSNFKRCIFNQNPLPDSYECQMDEVYVPIDINKLQLIDKIQITQPTFTRSDVMHNVENFQNKPRLILMLRWCGPNKNTEVRDFSDVMNYQDIIE